VTITDRAAQRALVEAFARTHPGSVLYDAASSTLLDVPSGKALLLDLGRVHGVEERRDGATGRPWLALARDDGSELGLTDAGVAFPPRLEATGPIAGLPAAVCLADLAAAEGRLGHFLDHHAGEQPGREHVSLFLFCLAIVDGARAAGFDVSAEERRLAGLLAALEARKRG
jgi:hypothetical protein